MKASSIVLGLSLLANLVLVGAVVRGVMRNPSSDRPPPNPAPAPTVAAPMTTDAVNAWSELRADDLKEQAEKLRADGFPPSMVRAIVAAQVRAGFAARRKQLETALGQQPFWRPADVDPTIAAAQRALMMEEQKAIKAVLGSDPVHGQAASLRRQFPGFADETIEQLAALRERYDEQRMELYSGIRGPGGRLPDEQAKMDALDKRMRAEIAGLLTPNEFEEYDLRTSNVANQLRYDLVAFNATEQEFRSLFKLKSAFEEQFGVFRGGASEEQMRARSEAQKQLNDQIKLALGPERFTEYQRGTDYNFRQTTQLIARLNLPAETANTLYAVQKDFEQRRNDLYRAGSGPPGTPAWDNMVQQATALQKEAVARVTPVLGNAQNIQAYKQYGGAWIDSLVPRPPPTATRPEPVAAPKKSG